MATSRPGQLPTRASQQLLSELVHLEQRLNSYGIQKSSVVGSCVQFRSEDRQVNKDLLSLCNKRFGSGVTYWLRASFRCASPVKVNNDSHPFSLAAIGDVRISFSDSFKLVRSCL